MCMAEGHVWLGWHTCVAGGRDRVVYHLGACMAGGKGVLGGQGERAWLVGLPYG